MLKPHAVRLHHSLPCCTRPSPLAVVVIGGGLGGASMAHIADKAGFKVTLIERRTGSVWKAGAPRGLNDPAWTMAKMIVPLRDTVSGPESKRVQDDVVGLDAKTRTLSLSGGGSLSFDYCVVAVGAQSSSPSEPPIGVYSLQGIEDHFTAVAVAIKAAKKIVVVGGGAAGIEIAGATRDSVGRDVALTVVHAGRLPVSGSLPGADAKALDALGARLAKQCAAARIGLKLGARVTNLGPADCPGGFRWDGGAEFSLQLSTGEALSADLVLWCVGARSNAPQLMPPASLDERSGLVKVQPTLEVEGMEGAVFAIGDCTNLAEPKLLVTTRSKTNVFPGAPAGHADTVLSNLLLLAAGQPASAAWKPPAAFASIVPLTKKTGGSSLGVPHFMAGVKGGSFEYFTKTHWMSANAGKYGEKPVSAADETAVKPRLS